MTLNIKAQDKTQPQKFECLLHPDRIRRLQKYAESLNHSDVDYVLDRILDEVLPVEKVEKKADAKITKEKVDKGPTESTSRRVAA